MMFLIPILSIICICFILFKHAHTQDENETTTNDSTENDIQETAFGSPASKSPVIQIEDAICIPGSDECVETDN